MCASWACRSPRLKTRISLASRVSVSATTSPSGRVRNTPRSSRITDVQSNISFNWIKDSHLIKWGATFSRVYLNQPQNGNVRGTFNIQGRFTGSSLGDLLLGQLQNVSRRVGVTTNNFRSNSYGLFVSDDWKITRDLTLNLGLRYEIDLAPLDTNDRLATFVPGLDQIVLASDKDLPDLDSLLADVPTLLERVTTADAVGLGRRLIDTDWNNFAPRVGFAWRPLVLRRTSFGVVGASSTRAICSPGSPPTRGHLPIYIQRDFPEHPHAGADPAGPFSSRRGLSRRSGYPEPQRFRCQPADRLSTELELHHRA